MDAEQMLVVRVEDDGGGWKDVQLEVDLGEYGFDVKDDNHVAGLEAAIIDYLERVPA